jgi:ELWxxDGT repeat protein
MSSFSPWPRWLLPIGIVVLALGVVIALLSRAPLVAILLAALGLVGFVALRYQRWIHDCTRQLEDGSKIIETAGGMVEYAVFGAGGPAILFVHGQPGGYDQGEVLADAAVEHGFRMIAVSRPGYLRTPLDAGRSPVEQADAFTALLDALGIDRVAVVGLSGGGPAAIQFALRHPARCLALVAISAVSRAKSPPAEFMGRLLSTRLFTSNFAGWLVGAAAALRPSLLAQALAPDAKSRAEILSDPRKLSALAALAQAGIKLPAQRRAGSQNHIKQFAGLPLFPVEAIRVPTLVVHGTDDNLVPYSHGLFITETVPGAELYAIEGGTHIIIVTHADQVVSWLFAFLDECCEEKAVQSGAGSWRSDGTQAGTVLVKDINLGSGDSYPRPLVAANGTLFFSASDGIHRQELWKTDGTKAGTVLVKNINLGKEDSVPRGRTVIGDTLFFTARDGTHGRELWKSDGTSAVTTLVGDIYPGTQSGLHNWGSLAGVGRLLFFAAADGKHGSELWAYDTGLCSPPKVPILFSPPDRSSTYEAKPLFQWLPVAGATEYRIRVVEVESGMVMFNEKTSKTYHTSGVSLPRAAYYWRIRAFNECGESEWSTRRSLTILATGLEAPTLSSSPDGSTTCEKMPNFQWSRVQDATWYRIQVDQDNSFLSPAIDHGTADTTYRPDSPLGLGRHFWRVRAGNDSDVSDWSSTWAFTRAQCLYLPLVLRGR